jgi:hypothetical protein
MLKTILAACTQHRPQVCWARAEAERTGCANTNLGKDSSFSNTPLQLVQVVFPCGGKGNVLFDATKKRAQQS